VRVGLSLGHEFAIKLETIWLIVDINSTIINGPQSDGNFTAYNIETDIIKNPTLTSLKAKITNLD